MVQSITEVRPDGFSCGPDNTRVSGKVPSPYFVLNLSTSPPPSAAEDPDVAEDQGGGPEERHGRNGAEEEVHEQQGEEKEPLQDAEEGVCLLCELYDVQALFVYIYYCVCIFAYFGKNGDRMCVL